MGAWDKYEEMAEVRGNVKRDFSYKREVRDLSRMVPNSLSYQEDVEIYPAEYCYNIEDEDIASHKFTQSITIINSDNLNEKTAISLPGEDIVLGDLIHWMDCYWVVTERDANTTLYTRCKLVQCNFLLKWITSDKKIIEQWCIIEDGTKYMTGELEDKNFMTTRGDTRVALTISRNPLTVKFDRESRFLVDDIDTPHKMSFLLTKPLKSGLTVNNKGVFKFILQEVTATEYDNHELGITDYYKYFPIDSSSADESSGDEDSTTSDSNSASTTSGKKVWL